MKSLLKSDERVVAVFRATKLVLVCPLAISIFLIFLPVFLFIPLSSFGLVGIILFWYSLGVGALWTIKKLFLWWRNYTLVTNARIIDVHQRGLFDQLVSEAGFYQIDDISFQKRGLIQHLFNCGTVILSLKGSKVNLEIKRVRKPHLVHALLTNLKNLFLGAEVSTLEKMIDKFKELGPTERKALLHSLSQLEKDDPANSRI